MVSGSAGAGALRSGSDHGGAADTENCIANGAAGSGSAGAVRRTQHAISVTITVADATRSGASGAAGESSGDADEFGGFTVHE